MKTDKTKIYGINYYNKIQYYNLDKNYNLSLQYQYLKEIHIPDTAYKLNTLICSSNPHLCKVIISNNCVDIKSIYCDNNPNLEELIIPKNNKILQIYCDPHLNIVNKEYIEFIRYKY